MKSMAEVLATLAKEQPIKRFGADSYEKEYTYSDAWERVQCVATTLSEKYSIGKGDRVLVICSQSVDYLIIDLACNLLGAIFVPVETNASEDRIRNIAAETSCKLYIVPSKSELLACSVVYEELLSGKSANNFSFQNSDDIAEILYTTGTTGKSKGIVISNRANIALAENIKYGTSMKDNNVELIPLVMSHSHGLRTFYANLLNGSTVVLTDGVMNITELFHLMEKYDVTSLDLSPSAAQIMIKLSKGKFWERARTLEYIEIGTASLPEELKEQLVNNLPGVHLFNFYGSTESGRTCVLDFSTEQGRKKCIGKPSRNAEIIFTDDAREPINATIDNPGLLGSRGPMNMSAYWNNDDLTHEVLKDNYVLTNDIGYIDKDGYIYIVGRRDDVINFNGIKISPTEIEDIVMQYEGIAECACVGTPDVVAGMIPKLFIVLKDEARFYSERFMEFLNERLDKNKLPKAVITLDSLPRTFNGKLDRKALRFLEGERL